MCSGIENALASIPSLLEAMSIVCGRRRRPLPGQTEVRSLSGRLRSTNCVRSSNGDGRGFSPDRGAEPGSDQDEESERRRTHETIFPTPTRHGR